MYCFLTVKTKVTQNARLPPKPTKFLIEFLNVNKLLRTNNTDLIYTCSKIVTVISPNNMQHSYLAHLRMPIHIGYSFVFAILQIGKRLIFFQMAVRFVSKVSIFFSQYYPVIKEYIYNDVLLHCHFEPKMKIFMGTLHLQGR